MGINEKEREQTILNAATELLLRQGYDKTTMGDVADAVHLNRRLVYLLFASKDDLMETLLLRELKTYIAAWHNWLEQDPLGGTVASVYRGMLYTTKEQPLMIALYTRDERIFGKYLHKTGNIFTQVEKSSSSGLTHNFLHIMQQAGVIRNDINIRAMSFILDALTPAILQTISSHREEKLNNQPSFEELMQTIAQMLEKILTPEAGANIEAGKAILRQGLIQAQSHLINIEQHRQNKL